MNLNNCDDLEVTEEDLSETDKQCIPPMTDKVEYKFSPDMIDLDVN